MMRTRIIINTRPAGLMDLWQRGMELNLDLPTIDTQWRIVHIRSQIREWGGREADTGLWENWTRSSFDTRGMDGVTMEPSPPKEAR